MATIQNHKETGKAWLSSNNCQWCTLPTCNVFPAAASAAAGRCTPVESTGLLGSDDVLWATASPAASRPGIVRMGCRPRSLRMSEGRLRGCTFPLEDSRLVTRGSMDPLRGGDCGCGDAVPPEAAAAVDARVPVPGAWLPTVDCSATTGDSAATAGVLRLLRRNRPPRCFLTDVDLGLAGEQAASAAAGGTESRWLSVLRRLSFSGMVALLRPMRLDTLLPPSDMAVRAETPERCDTREMADMADRSDTFDLASEISDPSDIWLSHDKSFLCTTVAKLS